MFRNFSTFYIIKFSLKRQNRGLKIRIRGASKEDAPLLTG